MDSLEKLITLGTQDTGRRQTKQKNTTQKTETMSNTRGARSYIFTSPGMY